MRRLLCAVLLAFACLATASAAPNEAMPGADIPGCTDINSLAGAGAATQSQAPVQLAQSGCRGNCSSRRGYCMSSCRDSQCRAICNDIYQSCVSSCR